MDAQAPRRLPQGLPAGGTSDGRARRSRPRAASKARASEQGGVKSPFGAGRLSQHGIVFAIFVLMFVGCALFLPGFLTASNMLGLLQNVAILGILGLGMAIVVLGRRLHIPTRAVRAVRAGLVRRMVQDRR